MLQRDYILELIEQFVRGVVESLRLALSKVDPARAREATEEVEQAVSELVDLDAEVAMQLAPESLVTMMQLSGISDSVADYVAYTLSVLGHAYDGMGDHTTAAMRRDQAQAVADAYGYDFAEPPAGLEDFTA